uniref:Thyrotropin-releasing hormone receptor n=1 Tax=Caenorhabditis japonica TaxID=281687 RepID=A0A8R1IU11_CAEJA
MPHEMMYLLGPNDHYLFGKVGCVLLTYLPYLAMNTSSLSILAFTIERYYGICNPYKARTMCTVKRATCIIFGVWLFSMLYHSYWLFLATLIQDDIGTSCSFRLERNSHAYKIVFLLDFVLWYVLPILCDIVIYVKIGITLSQCGDKLKKSVNPKISNEMIVEKAKTSSTSMGNFSGRDSHISGKRNSSKGKNQVVKMLAIVVAVFAICWLPYRGMVVYNSFVSDPKYSWSPDWYINLSKTLVFINCAINPILYNLMSARFRAAFKSLFTKRKNSAFKTTAFNPRHRLNTMDVMSSAEPKSLLITSCEATS